MVQMSCPFFLSTFLLCKHLSLLLPQPPEQSGVCPGWALWQPAEEVVPTHLAKDRVSTGLWQQMRCPVSIHFSWLSLPFFLIVLSTNCLWLCWQVDWIKFEDPKKSSLGKWHLRKDEKLHECAGHSHRGATPVVSGAHIRKCRGSGGDYSIASVFGSLTWSLSLNTVHGRGVTLNELLDVSGLGFIFCKTRNKWYHWESL